MLDSFSSIIAEQLSISNFLICIFSAIAIGIIISLVYMFRSVYTKSFVITLALLPPIVCVVIMMVSGNLGASFAVAGAFALVRFRSVPGTAKEIVSVFFAMAAGVAVGIGYVGFAFIFVIIVSAFMIIYNVTPFGKNKITTLEKSIRVTIPEDLDYADVLSPIFDNYTKKYELITVKTSNMGSLYKLTYNVQLKNADCEKELIDALRCINGNLEITSSIQMRDPSEL